MLCNFFIYLSQNVPFPSTRFVCRGCSKFIACSIIYTVLFEQFRTASKHDKKGKKLSNFTPICHSYIKPECILYPRYDYFHCRQNLSIYHPQFYTNSIFLWVDSYKDTFRTILPVELFLIPWVLVFWKTICLSTLCSFLRDWNREVFPWSYKAAVGINIGWVSLAPQLVLYVYSRLFLQVFELKY